LKYLLALLLGLILGAFAYRHYTLRSSPPPPVSTPDTSYGTEPAVSPTDPPAAAPEAEVPTSTPPVVPASPSQQQPPVVPANPSLPATTASGSLLLPVQGVTREQLQDTFTDARSQGRSHDAIDIMAPAGTPVLAVADGHVEKLFTSERGGLTIYQFEPSGRLAYYYAHLQAYADGIAQGQPVRRGQVIGYVGSTGNANPAAPHLHFAIFMLGPERNWWQGQAINPYPVLMGRSVP
jgi:peptidoglycan LD-endopeptidase LytH